MIGGGVAVALLAVIGGGAWWLFQSSPGPSPPLASTGVPTSPPSPQGDSPVPSGATEPTPVGQASSVQSTNTADSDRSPDEASPGAVQDAQAPPNQQVAIAGLDALRRHIAQWVGSRNCALLQGELADDGVLALQGYAGNRSVEELRQGVTAFVPPGQIEWQVDGVDQVFCPALNALRPITPGFAALTGPRLDLQMAGGKTRLRDGERIRMRLTMPDFAGRLRVDYLAHDGSVQHLYPQLADPKLGIAADPARTYRAGEKIILDNPAWVIGEPYGTDMIIAVASSEPLFEHPRPSNAELADEYLRQLQAQLDKLRLQGDRLAGAAIAIEALPK
jgi:hypothetical protein